MSLESLEVTLIALAGHGREQVLDDARAMTCLFMMIPLEVNANILVYVNSLETQAR